MTLSKSFSKKTKLSYQDLKYWKIFLKLRKFNKRSKMLLIFPKIIVFFCFFTSCETPKNITPHFSDVSNPIGAKQLFSLESLSCDDTVMLDKNLSLYALSKLKLRNYDSFFKYLLLLSGDINLNPGPIQNPCKKCLGSVNKKVIFCKNCNFWFHKKCELP